MWDLNLVFRQYILMCVTLLANMKMKYFCSLHAKLHEKFHNYYACIFLSYYWKTSLKCWLWKRYFAGFSVCILSCFAVETSASFKKSFTEINILSSFEIKNIGIWEPKYWTTLTYQNITESHFSKWHRLCCSEEITTWWGGGGVLRSPIKIE